MYYNIACEQAKLYHEREAERCRLELGPVGEEELSVYAHRLEQCYREREQCAVIAITFAGMALEAFFYDYAAESLGDRFVHEHLDKLDLKSTFLVYPRLIRGQSPDKSLAAYESLTALVRLRNDLVHFKSKGFKVDEVHKASDVHDELNERRRSGVDQAVQAVVLVLTELGALHGNKSLFVQRITWSVAETQASQ
jgi:hypothetical protein